MNPFIRTLLEYMLTRNISFMLFFGILWATVSGLTVKQSFTAGMKWAAALLCGMLAAAALYTLLPDGAVFLFPAGVLLFTLLIVRWMKTWGALDGEWAGMPRQVVAYVPLAGSMLLVRAEHLTGLDAVAASIGTAAGAYVALVIVVSLIEQIRISEAPLPCRRLGVLLFAIALFALAFAGFQFF